MKPATPPSVRLVLLAFACSGASALAYEVIWTRALSLVLGSTTYAVSTMLATFMAGLALGSWWGGRLADRTTAPLRVFGLCELGIGILGIVSLPLIAALPGLYLGLYRSFHLYPPLFYALQTAFCALVMLAPTTLMGATFPVVSRAITGRLEELGRKVGNAYSVNTVGAVVGSLATGFLLIPTLGMRGAVLTAGGLNLAVGAAILLRERAARASQVALWLVLYLAAGSWTWAVHDHPSLFSFYSAYRFLEEPLPFSGIVARDRATLEPLFGGEYAEGRLEAYRTREGHLLLQVGGKIEGTGQPDMGNTLLLAYLPIAAHPAPGSMLVVGLGAGVTLSAAKEHIPSVEVVELHSGVIEAVSRFGPTGALQGTPIHRDDARHFLMAKVRSWDIISSEPSYPTDPVVGNLFTREFFELAASRLTPDGIFCQWLPYHMLTNEDVTLMVKTFASVFPHALLFKVTDGLDLLLLGSRRPFAYPPEEIRRRVAALNSRGWPLRFELSRSPDEIRQIAARPEVPINTDDHPILEFRMARNLRVGNLALLEAARSSTEPE